MPFAVLVLIFRFTGEVAGVLARCAKQNRSQSARIAFSPRTVWSERAACDLLCLWWGSSSDEVRRPLLHGLPPAEYADSHRLNRICAQDCAGGVMRFGTFKSRM